MRDLPSAIELIGAAALTDNHLDEVEEAANFVVAVGIDAFGRDAANRTLRQAPPTPSPATAEKEITNLRELIQIHPRNSLAWLDLGLAFTQTGFPDRAKRAMEVAVGLAPMNRFVLRSVARGMIHVGEIERAWSILERSPATPQDPWLVSAEIAVSMIANHTSDLTKVARSLLASGTFPAFHLGELASALATLEASAGNIRGAKRLFKQSLLAPSENCVAQIRWAAQQQILELDPAILYTPSSFEARAWTFFNGGDWEKALEQAENWLDDQSFSTGPAALSAYLATTSLQRPEMGARFALRGLRANPNQPLLLNNLAFALASTGDVVGARKALSKMRFSGEDKSLQICHIATSGFIHFRSGDTNLGRKLYLQAIEEAKAAGMKRLTARAFIFYALEEFRAASDVARDALEAALRVTENIADNNIIHLRRRLTEAMTKLRG